MLSRLCRWVMVAAVVSLSATGCALNQGGSEDPSESPAPQPAPQRPQELALAGKQSADICKLLLPEQQIQVGVERSDPAPAGGDPGCIWLSVPGAKTDATIEVEALDMGIEEAVERAGKPFPETAASYEIQGFKAEQGQGGAGLESLGCRVDVDVAEGQTLEVFYSPTLSGTVSNQDMCTKAKQAAEFAVTNLQAQG